MSLKKKCKVGRFSDRKSLLVVVSAVLVLILLIFVKTGFTAENEEVRYYKMISSVEYKGEKKFNNQAQALFTAKKQFLPDEIVRYHLYSDDTKDFSFVCDKKTKQMSEVSKGLEFEEKINNRCVLSLKKVTRQNIGKTWKQNFELSSLYNWLPKDISFTLTAKKIKTGKMGEMIAVRALSEPFTAMTGSGVGKKAGKGLKCRMNAVYLFDPEIDEVYMSSSVFTSTKERGFGKKEILRHEVATYITNANGRPINLGLGKKTKAGKEFAKFAKKINMVSKPIKIAKGKKMALPQWAKFDGLKVSRAVNICAATACEGAVNPVGMVFMAANRMLGMQSLGITGAIGSSSVGAAFASGAGTASVVGGGTIAGMGVGTAAIVGGGTTGGVAAGGGFSGGGGGSSSAATP